MIDINFTRIHESAVAPTRASHGDAAYDLCSVTSTFLSPMERRIVGTGLIIEIPEGYYGRIAPRSGLAIKYGIDVLAGVIDSSYRGEVGVVLINLNPILPNSDYENVFGPQGRFRVSSGDRIAQLIIEKYYDVEWKEANVPSDTDRGEGGFGSTGK